VSQEHSKYHRLFRPVEQHSIAERLKQIEITCGQTSELPFSKAYTLNLIGALAYQAQDLELAKELIKRAISISTSNGDYYNNYGVVLFANNQLEEAAKALRHALFLQPDNTEIYKNLGLTLHALGRLPEAINVYRQALTIKGNEPGIYFNIGKALFALGRFRKAAVLFKLVTALKPRFADAYLKLGNTRYLQGELLEFIEAYQSALAIDPGRAEIYHNLGASLAAIGKTREAAAAYRRTLDLSPSNSTASHMLAALTGKTTKGAPVEYIEQLFDRYSATFDQHVVETLNYKVPVYLHQIFSQFLRKNYHFENAIDLGCGTGIAGLALRPLCDRLCGLDLSSKMIEVARKKRIYDELAVDEMTHFLHNTSEIYNLFVATDVFIYTGDLYDIFKAVRDRSRRGTYLIFNTETVADGDYVLRKSGRYAHSPDYIQLLARKTGFDDIMLKSVALRKEGGNWIQGDLYILKT
jgi:predicted TPR repeat methyltransferase